MDSVTGWRPALAKSLRLRLTFVYLIAGLTLLIGLTGGTYVLLRRYFDITTDLALQHRMAHELASLGATVPKELADADRAWYSYRDNLIPSPIQPSRTHKEQDEQDDDDRFNKYEGDVSAIFVLPLGVDGRLIYDPNPSKAPIAPDRAAADAALRVGSDTRTTIAPTGEQVRLLTYKVGRNDGPALLQLGRVLTDQQRLLSQVLFTMVGLGALTTVGIGFGSWYVAGRALKADTVAWERQQSFVANASHELRSPLALIRASAEVAKRGLSADADRTALLDDIINETDYMSRLTDDLLLLSRLDTGSMVFDKHDVAIAELFEDLVRQVGRVALERQIRLEVSEASGIANADSARLRQVLLILLDNALRFTQSGGQVTLNGHQTDRTVTITITDTGIGISPKAISKVFDRFFQADNARGHGNGSGIGLSLARALIHAQGGEIRLQSVVGTGTVATITIPAAPHARKHGA